MRDGTPQKTDAYSLEYVRIFRGQEHNGDAWPSYAARERTMRDRCLRILTIELIDNLTGDIEAFIAIEGRAPFPLIDDDL
jgi:hypothetical protein